MAVNTSLLSGTALITGAGSGIGQATAAAFVKHGVQNLTLIDLNATSLANTEKVLKQINDNVQLELITMNVAKEFDVIDAIKQTICRFGRLDYAVNNAGIGGPPVPMDGMEVEGWQKCFDVNATGVFLCQREEVKQMLNQESQGLREGRGSIINVASMLGTTGLPRSIPNTAYVASKHAVVGMSKTDGIYYANKGIRINAMCPGYVETPLLLLSAGTSEVMKTEFASIPMGRLAKMEEIADSIVYLASPMSSFMTGASLIVDGGYTAN